VFLRRIRVTVRFGHDPKSHLNRDVGSAGITSAASPISPLCRLIRNVLKKDCAAAQTALAGSGGAQRTTGATAIIEPILPLIREFRAQKIQLGRNSRRISRPRGHAGGRSKARSSPRRLTALISSDRQGAERPPRSPLGRPSQARRPRSVCRDTLMPWRYQPIYSGRTSRLPLRAIAKRQSVIKSSRTACGRY